MGTDYIGKRLRELLEGATIAYIPTPRNGKDFGIHGWGTGKSKVLIARKIRLWCLYILETELFERATEQQANAWFDNLSDGAKREQHKFAEGMADWHKSHTINLEEVNVTNEVISKRVLQSRIAMHKDNLLKSMKPDFSELDDTEVIRLFSLFAPKFTSAKNELNIYGDTDFVFLDDRYSCISGQEAIGFQEAELICCNLITGQ